MPHSASEPSGFFDPQFVKYYEQTDNTRQIDLTYYVSLAKAASGPVLDAGCGSGRILVPMLEAGVEAEGFDPSAIMLDALQTRLTRKGLTAEVWQDSMPEFTAKPDHYALVMCTFNTFLHLRTHDEQLEALKRAFDCLRPGGKLVLDITNPFNFDIFSRRAIGKTFEATLYDQETDTETTIWRWFERDLIRQTGIYHREYQMHGATGDTTHTTTIDFRWSYPSELELLLSLAGFENPQVFGDFKNEPLAEDSEMQVWIGTKP
jgi:SAM-dependent methyltransferase